MRLAQLTLVIALATSGAAACTKARAATEPVMPELVPPPPPPRVVERFPDEPVPTIVPSPGEMALNTPPAKPPARPPAKVEPPKLEPPRVEPERAAAPPTLTLKPAPGVAAQTEASIRALLESAQRTLQRVNYAALNADGRAQFDTARGFMQQADEALKVNNLAFASKLADKAATMAAVLGR